MTLSTLLAVGLLTLTFTVECVQYGHNYVPVRRDNEAVAANFQDVQGFELVAPAFTRPDSVSSQFRNGTEGPTDDATMGMVTTKVMIAKLTFSRQFPAFDSRKEQ